MAEEFTPSREGLLSVWS